MDSICFLAYGGVWIDEISRPDQPPLQGILGGTVIWATLGARLFAEHNSRSIALAPRIGSDFPPSAIKMLQSWGMRLQIHEEGEVPTPRGVVEYRDPHDASKRSYRRVTEPLHLDPSHVADTDLLSASTVHFFDTPSAVQSQVQRLVINRTDYLAKHADSKTSTRPFIVWEPQAKSCSLDTLDAHLETARIVDVFSPNHAELGLLFGDDHVDEHDKTKIECYASKFLQSGVGPSGGGCVVIRAASQGCLVFSREQNPVWLPAYHKIDRVIDPTGAGNTFLGGLAIGWIQSKSYIKAAAFGTVAASFAIEQVGLPTRRGLDGEETWNDEKVFERLDSYFRTAHLSTNEGAVSVNKLQR
ncbi:Ribokinase-like protein [Polychaeton citri CBS 116435]|uniref:Ribokinase-like protein n=1 Tax=Polychaeton citri CBS 116435 TaxID=1314669 RepID=A0A9P4Q3X4_9PEZI|nr:Ribokinase-like protein [Polychaeton citri CBS 116435]